MTSQKKVKITVQMIINCKSKEELKAAFKKIFPDLNDKERLLKCNKFFRIMNTIK